MFHSTRGNSFGISKKILCVVMTISLSLMMLPSALFRTEAQAAPVANDDVFVKADSDMTNFGQFAFNPNANSANISTYTQNDLLHAIGCKAETEASLQDQVANEVKAFLVKNQFSLVDDAFPAVNEGYTLKGTSIANVASQLASLTATYDKTKGTAKFVTSTPTSYLDTGSVIITAEYAKLIAEYDAVFSNLTTDLAQAQELVINTKTCEGKVTITPTINKDDNGKTVYKLNVDTAIKNVNTLTTNYNVSVRLDTNAEPNDNSGEANEGEATEVDLNSIIGEQDMRTIPNMCEKIKSLVNATAVRTLDIGGTPTPVYLGIKGEASALLATSAYTLTNTNTQTVTVNTTNTFDLYTDEARVTQVTPTQQLTFTTSIFTVKPAASMSDAEITSALEFWDEEAEVATDITQPDAFFTGEVTVKAKANHSVADATKTSITFSESCVPQLAEKSDTIKTVKLLAQFTTSDNVIKKLEKDLTFKTDNGFIGYEIIKHDTSDLSIFDQIHDFFFASGNVDVTFKFAQGNGYTSAKVTKGTKTICELTKTSTTDNFVWNINTDDINSVEKDLKDAKIKPKKNLIGYPKTSIETTGQATKIIGNAPAPVNVALTWGADGTGSAPEEGSATEDDIIFNLVVTMPDGEGDIFDYTLQNRGDKETPDLIATLIDIQNGTPAENEDPTTIVSYKKGNNPGEWKQGTGTSSNVWTTTYTLSAASGTEHKYTLNISNISDLLGRTASDSSTTALSNLTFYIDKRAPELTVNWTPADPVGVSGNYFNTRYADIYVDEMNFVANKITINKKFTDYNGNVTEGPVTGLTWTPSGFVNSTRINCDEEGDYEFKITGKDILNHAMVVKGTTSTEYTESFTVDRTAPTCNVSFDNNSVVNGMYYTAARTATITIVERSFNGDSPEVLSSFINVQPNSIAGNDGHVGSYSENGWYESGKYAYSKTVSFYTEGTFSMTIDGKDKAENVMTPYAVGQFVIDWTKPNIQITGVENRQAYGDTAQPNVTITDANMAESTTCQVESLGATKGHPYSASPATSRTQYTYSYANPEKVAENDGVYRINVNAVDMAGNGDVQERVWSVNRFGSTYVIDAETETIMDGYVNKDSIKDIIVTEINPSGIDNHAIDMTKGSFTETLNEGSDYTANASGGDGSWYECVYTISKNFFKEDGKYTLNYISKDKAGNDNENTMENKNAERNAAVNVQFMYDNAKPTVSYDNLSESMYSEASHKATAKFEDNSKKFKEAKVIINGDEKYVSGDDLEKNNGKLDFELKDSGTPYTVETVAIDKAGNEMDKDVKSVVVTMNPFLLWFYNTPLFVGSLVGAGVIVAGVLFFLYSRGLWIFKK